MDILTQTSFIQRLGVTLPNFKQIKAQNWEFSHSCETKHDFKRTKARGYIFPNPKRTGFIFKCQHCGLSTSVPNLLKTESPSLYEEYALFAYRPTSLFVQEETKQKIPDANLNGLIPVMELNKTNPVLRFLRGRMIPEDKWHLLYVAKHFYQWAEYYKPEFKNHPDKSPRLVMPYFNGETVFGFTARTFSPSTNPKYINLLIDREQELVYGIERLNPNKYIYVVEGQIDSLFIDNCIAVGSASYNKRYLFDNKERCVIIPDNDWKRNPQVAGLLKAAIKHGFAVCFLPDTVEGKDPNEMVKHGLSIDDLLVLIKANIYRGLSAELEFSLQTKCR